MGGLIQGGSTRNHVHPPGASVNYAEHEADGTLVLHGAATYFEDLRIEPSVRTSGNHAPVLEKWGDDLAGTSIGVWAYSFDDVSAADEKEVMFSMQMPHAWKLGSDIAIHVHWLANLADTTATPRWGLEYCMAEIGTTFPDTTIVYAVGNTEADADVKAYHHYVTAFAAITPGASADGISTVLMGRLFRNSSNAADTYNVGGGNKCGLLYVDAHVECDALGSRSEWTK